MIGLFLIPLASFLFPVHAFRQELVGHPNPTREVINECDVFAPCENGASCLDKVDDYFCSCQPGFGGKNCSVPLTGCSHLTCFSGGTCTPYLVGETDHRYNCSCTNGFDGDRCQLTTTMSFNGTSFVAVGSERTEGFELLFRFRTTLRNGVLAIGQGLSFFTLQLKDGSLTLHSHMLNRFEGISIGDNLADEEWQKVYIALNTTHLTIGINSLQRSDEITPDNGGQTAFYTTYLGGSDRSTATLIREKTINFIGCMEDISVNGRKVREDSFLAGGLIQPNTTIQQQNTTKGCARKPQCNPNPCMNDGKCTDLWQEYKCECHRPFLGSSCQYSYTGATFGHENTTGSQVVVDIEDPNAFREEIELSMFIITRQSSGLIFHLGKRDYRSPIKNHIRGSLVDGTLQVEDAFGQGRPTKFRIYSAQLDDGNRHFLRVIRLKHKMIVEVNSTAQIYQEVRYREVPILAEKLYLGNLPEPTTTFFKGDIMDIRLSNRKGTERIVKLSDLQLLRNDTEPKIEESLGNVTAVDIKQGTVSDDTCQVEPCQNGGKCEVTWNDYQCQCKAGYKGGDCEELEYCHWYKCPADSTCRSLIDGHECITNATFDGLTTRLTYSASFEQPSALSNSISARFRSQAGGPLLSLASSSSVWPGQQEMLSVVVGNYGSLEVILREGDKVGNLTFGGNLSDGNWHTVSVTIREPFDIIVKIDDKEEEFEEYFNKDSTVISLLQFVSNAEVVVGSGGLGQDTDFFRGCMQEVRIGGVLLPFFTEDELVNSTAGQKFELQQRGDVTMGECVLCYQGECQNGGSCSDPSEEFQCNCPAGFVGPVCEENIDECSTSECVNGECRDGVNSYTCECKPGWTGTLCNEDLDEYETQPCQYGGTCAEALIPGDYTCAWGWC